MARTPAQAVATARRYSHYSPNGMCQQFVRTCFGIGGGFGSARQAWQGAKKRHFVSRGSQIPPGVPIYWLGGSRGYGHTAVSLGGGYCRSTDWPRGGMVGTARIDDIHRIWGEVLVGWAEDINGTTIPSIHHQSVKDNEPDLHLDKVIHAAKHRDPLYHGKFLKSSVAKEVGRGKMNLASPILGHSFHTQYIKVQEKFLRANNRRITNDAVDGIPGRESLSWLGRRHGFDVV